jgi:hypothetical protein
MKGETNMRVALKNVELEGAMDVVDYLGKGLPPKKDDANAVLQRVETEGLDLLEDEDDEDDESVFTPDWSNVEMTEVLNRVYQNNISNTKRWIGISVGAGVLGVLFGAFFINTPKKEKDKFYE